MLAVAGWAVLAGMQDLPSTAIAQTPQATHRAIVPAAVNMPQGPALEARPSPAADRRDLAKAPSKPRVLRVKVTAYCPCVVCCGDGDGVTASGRKVGENGGRFVATAGAVPMGSRVIVPGYSGGAAVPVWDRMGPGASGRLDVFFPTHRQARQWGVRYLDVVVCPRPS